SALNESVPLLAALLSIEVAGRYAPLNLTPTGQKQRTFEALIDWLRGEARRRPILLVVEDLHWADPSTLELLELILDAVQRERVLVLLSSRPEFTTPWSARTHQSQLALSRLRKHEVAAFIRAQTGCQSLPSDLVDRIYDRTGGVPLFVEEYTKNLLETGELVVADGAASLTGEKSLSKIPASLQDLLVARLDRLDSLPDVVQMGATLGREFSHELIVAAAEIPATQVASELDKLVAGDILVPRGRDASRVYQFKHALLQEAAYQSLVKKKRQRFHRRAAETLEGKFRDLVETQPEIVAHHWSEAVEPSRAVPFWLQAGLRSQRRSANREAIEQFRRGLAELDTLPADSQRDRWELDLRVVLGVVLMAAKGYAASEVGDCFHRARELCESMSAKTRLFFVLRGLWTWRLLRDELDICCRLCDEMLELSELPELNDVRAEAQFLPGNTYYYCGDFERSLKHLEIGWKRFDRDQSEVLMARTGLNCGVTILCHIALAHWQLGRPDLAFDKMDEAMRLAESLEHPFSLAFALYHRRRLQQYCRLDDDVASSVVRELALAREQGFVFREAQALMCQAAVSLRRGAIAESRAQLQQGEQLYRSAKAKLSLTHHFTYMADVYLEVGDVDSAEAALDKALEVQRTSTERYLAAELLRLRGELLLARRRSGSPDGSPNEETAATAERLFREALDVADSQQARSRALRVAVSLARLLIELGRRDEARALIDSRLSGFARPLADPRVAALPDFVAARRILDEGT
ncbi:MAG TPA: hypothetical protein PLV92_06105, partial [Pirellulaceae bacterium]|nr:hypothetical protein [Pirellulaceae bacterium]